jgi:hypothetical protein
MKKRNGEREKREGEIHFELVNRGMPPPRVESYGVLRTVA